MSPLTQLIVLMSGMVALVAVGIAGMVTIEWLRPDGHNTQLNTEIVGVITIVGVQIFGYIKSIINGQQIEKKSEEIKQKIEGVEYKAEAAANKADIAAKNAEHAAETASSLAREKR